MPCVDAAVDLPVDDQRVDHRRRSRRRRRSATRRRVARLRVDLDDSGVRAARPGEVRRVVDAPSPRAPAPCRPGGCAPSTPRTRAALMPIAGRAPLHRELPVRELEVVLGRLRAGAPRSRVAFSMTFSRRVPERDAADRERAAAVGVHARAVTMAVSPCSTSTSSSPTPSWSATICAQRRLVALAVRRRAGHDLHRPGRQEADRRRVPAARAVADRAEDAARARAAHLDVRREADAELLRVAALAPRRLLGAERRRSRAARAPGRASRRSRPSRSSGPDASVLSGTRGMKFRRRSSTGSLPSSRASASMARSIAYVASGRPAPR